jgi:glycosyltransferase involved in cell wall biosynthesis
MIDKRSPEISAIIIFLNSKKYLSSAINSVLAQTYQDWELLLVDDGSFDGSTEIAKEFAMDYPSMISYYEHLGHTNLGMSASRNLGLSRARGSFVAFLDSDDLWPVDKLEQQVNILHNNPGVNIVFGNIRTFYEGPGTKANKDLGLLEFPPGEIIEPEQIYRKIFIGPEKMLTTFGRLLIRREALDDVCGFEDEFRSLGEDVVAWGKIALTSKAIAINGCALLYRRHLKASSYGVKDPTIFIESGIRVASFLKGYLSNQPAQIRAWALAIIDESLFQYYVKKAWYCSDISTKRILYFGDRRIQLVRMFSWLRQNTSLITPWRFIQIVIRLFIGEKGCKILRL